MMSPNKDSVQSVSVELLFRENKHPFVLQGNLGKRYILCFNLRHLRVTLETSGVQEMLKYFWRRRRKSPDAMDQKLMLWLRTTSIEKKDKDAGWAYLGHRNCVFSKRWISRQNLHPFFLGFFFVKHQYWRDPDFQATLRSARILRLVRVVRAIRPLYMLAIGSIHLPRMFGKVSIRESRINIVTRNVQNNPKYSKGIYSFRHMKFRPLEFPLGKYFSWNFGLLLRLEVTETYFLSL